MDLMGFSLSSESLPPPGWTVSLLLLALLLRFLKIFSYPEKPIVTTGKKSSSKETRLDQVLQSCAILNDKYNPPLIWGRCGHLQTAVYGILGHASLRRSYNRRCFLKLADGATVSYDIFEPTEAHPSGQDITLALCPGIANSSESNYIRTCVHFAQEHGYRCAVLNHLGALASVSLTSNRIFTYGGTDELEAMMDHLVSLYATTKFISVGFSMGANITTCYLSKLSVTSKSMPILVGLSVCQGYSANASTAIYHDWENGRRVYNYIITENMKRLLRRNYRHDSPELPTCRHAVAPHVKSGLINEQRLWTATSLLALDENYNRRVHGYKSITEFYAACSCLPRIAQITIPMVFVNALDDPIIPQCLWEPVQEMCRSSTHHAFILMKHGGHLGFLEGKSVKPSSVSWLDRFIVQLADGAVEMLQPGSP